MNNRMKWASSVVAIIVALGSSGYLAGLLAQLLRNYDFWKQSGGPFSADYGPELPCLDPISAWMALLDFPYGLYSIGLVVLSFLILFFFVLRIGRDGRGTFDDDRNLTYSNEGTYGTSGFMTEAERKKVLLLQDVNRTKGVILGKLGTQVLSLSPDSRMNDNVIVYGSSGSRKSRSYVRNRVFQAVIRRESLIITDCKGEIYEMSDYLQAHGYTIRVFNLVNPECADSWDCLGEIHGDDLMAQIFSDVVIQNSNNGKSDRFWDDAEQNLLKALLLYVDQEYSPDQRNLSAVYDLLTGAEASLWNPLVSSCPRASRKILLQCFPAGIRFRPGRRRDGLAGRLQTLQNRSIRSITSLYYRVVVFRAPLQGLCATL